MKLRILSDQFDQFIEAAEFCDDRTRSPAQLQVL
jgi:hypothetical protein